MKLRTSALGVERWALSVGRLLCSLLIAALCLLPSVAFAQVQSVTTNANGDVISNQVNFPTGKLKISGTAVGGVTGAGNAVLGTSPTLVTPNLGTPSLLVLTNATGTPSAINLTNATNLPSGALPTVPINKGGTNATTAYAGYDNLSIHGADIASAATLNLDNATGNVVDVTGTTTITAITLADGRERTVRFTGVLTLTKNSVIILPGTTNITTAAGDFATFRGYAAGVVRCVNYQRAAQTVDGLTVDDLDTDSNLGANSDTKVPSQKAIKTYVGSVIPNQSVNHGDAPTFDGGNFTNLNGDSVGGRVQEARGLWEVSSGSYILSIEDDTVLHFNYGSHLTDIIFDNGSGPMFAYKLLQAAGAVGGQSIRINDSNDGVKPVINAIIGTAVFGVDHSGGDVTDVIVTGIVSDVSYSSAGHFVITFAADQPDTNYTVAITTNPKAGANYVWGAIEPDTVAVSGFTVLTPYERASVDDPASVRVTIFR
jgi:hypothetical protein